MRCLHSTSIYLKRIRTEKINKVTHRSESSQPILRHRERRSTSPLLYHFTSLLPTPLTVLSHHPPLLQSSYSGCLKGRTECTERLRIPPRKDQLTRRACGLSLAEAPAPTCCLSEKRPLPPLFTLPPLSSNKQLRPRTGNSLELSGKRWIQIRLNQTSANFVVTAKNFLEKGR